MGKATCTPRTQICSKRKTNLEVFCNPLFFNLLSLKLLLLDALCLLVDLCNLLHCFLILLALLLGLFEVFLLHALHLLKQRLRLLVAQLFLNQPLLLALLQLKRWSAKGRERKVVRHSA